jgi:hypothetical protein
MAKCFKSQSEKKIDLKQFGVLASFAKHCSFAAAAAQADNMATYRAATVSTTVTSQVVLRPWDAQTHLVASRLIWPDHVVLGRMEY